MKRLAISFVLILIGSLLFAGARGQRDAADFPSRSITLICSYGAGGGTDLAMRVMAEFAGPVLGQTVVVENRTGGAGSNGLLAGLDARRDGYTLVSATVDLLTLPLLGITDRIRMDTFEVLGAVNGEPAAIIVRTDSPWRTLNDFLAAARSRPGQISLANAGAGNIWHLSAIGIEEATGISFNHVPYQEGAASAITGLLGGHVDAVMCSPAEAAAHIEAGTLRALAVALDTRLEAFPNVPTFRENGIELISVAVRGVAIPSDVPEAQKAILRDAFSRAINDPGCRQRILDLRMTYLPMDAQQFQAMLDSMRPTFERAIEIYLRGGR
jgi:tripartite-type tricarboxylate transporter receptor subunit TctC